MLFYAVLLDSVVSVCVPFPFYVLGRISNATDTDLKFDLEIPGTQTSIDCFPLLCYGNDQGVPNRLLSP